MQSNYPFLKKMVATETRRAQQEIGKLRREMATFGVSGSGSSFMGNTGYGSNGKLEPDKPTHLAKTPQGNYILDEGEDLYKTKSGGIEVIPANQSQLGAMKAAGTPAMDTGGYIPGPGKQKPAVLPTTRYNTPSAPTTSAPQPESFNLNPPGPQTLQTTKPAPTVAPDMGSVPEVGATTKQSSVVGEQLGLPKGDYSGATDINFDSSGNLVGTQARTMPVQKPQPTTMPGGAPSVNIGAGAAPKPQPVTGEALALPVGDYGAATPIEFDASGQRIPPDQIGAETETTTPADTFGAKQDMALGGLQKYAQGATPADIKQMEYLRSVRKGEAAAARGSLEQTMAQLGYTPQEAMIERAMQDRDISAQNTALLQQYGSEMGERAFASAQLMPAEVRAAERMTMERQTFNKTEGWKEYEGQLLAGDTKGAAKTFKDLTGNDIDMTRLDEEYKYEKNKRERGEGWEEYDRLLFGKDFPGAAAEYKRITGDDISLENLENEYNYETGKQKREEGWEKYDRQLISGDTIGAAKTFEELTGSGIDMTTLEEDRTYLKKIRELGLESDQIAVDSARLNLTSAQYVQVASFANIGYDLGRINEVLDLDLTPTEFNSIYDKTPMGQLDFSRKMDGISTLMAAGGAENLGNAAAKLNELYPDLNINFDKLITAEKSADFVSGMDFLTSIVKSTTSYENAGPALEESGVAKLLGMTEGEVESMYNETKLLADPLYRMMNGFKDSVIMEAFDVGAEEVPKIKRQLGLLSAFGVISVGEDGKISTELDQLEALKEFLDVDDPDDPDDPEVIPVAATPAEFAEKLSTDPIVGSWAPSQRDDKLIESFQEANPDTAMQTEDNYRQWYNSTGRLDNLSNEIKEGDPTSPLVKFDLDIKGSSIGKYLTAWQGLELSRDQFMTLAKDPKYKSNMNLKEAVELGSTIFVKKSEWNKSLGKIVNIDGLPYMIGGVGSVLPLPTGSAINYFQALTDSGASVKENPDGSWTTVAGKV